MLEGFPHNYIAVFRNTMITRGYFYSQQRFFGIYSAVLREIAGMFYYPYLACCALLLRCNV